LQRQHLHWSMESRASFGPFNQFLKTFLSRDKERIVRSSNGTINVSTLSKPAHPKQLIKAFWAFPTPRCLFVCTPHFLISYFLRKQGR
jgi:hypothetical protein